MAHLPSMGNPIAPTLVRPKKIHNRVFQTSNEEALDGAQRRLRTDARSASEYEGTVNYCAKDGKYDRKIHHADAALPILCQQYRGRCHGLFLLQDRFLIAVCSPVAQAWRTIVGTTN